MSLAARRKPSTFCVMLQSSRRVHRAVRATSSKDSVSNRHACCIKWWSTLFSSAYLFGVPGEVPLVARAAVPLVATARTPAAPAPAAAGSSSTAAPQVWSLLAIVFWSVQCLLGRVKRGRTVLHSCSSQGCRMCVTTRTKAPVLTAVADQQM